MKLAVKLNNVFGDDTPKEEMVVRATAAGADGIGFRPWYDPALSAVTATAREGGTAVAYLSGGSPGTDGPAFPLADPTRAATAISDLEDAITVADRAGAGYLNVIPGWADDTLDSAAQRRTIVDSLQRVAPAAEAAGVTLALEPINTAVDLPGIYLTESGEAAQIVTAVDSPAVEILFDCYHQQITEGNLIGSLRAHVDQIGYVHIGDVPGRHEPGTGEIAYQNVFDALAEAGYVGYVGCEFSPLIAPEAAIRRVGAMLPDG